MQKHNIKADCLAPTTSRSMISVPVISGDRVLGSISLENYERENAYGAGGDAASDDDRRVAWALRSSPRACSTKPSGCTRRATSARPSSPIINSDPAGDGRRSSTFQSDRRSRRRQAARGLRDRRHGDQRGTTRRPTLGHYLYVYEHGNAAGARSARCRRRGGIFDTHGRTRRPVVAQYARPTIAGSRRGTVPGTDERQVGWWPCRSSAATRVLGNISDRELRPRNTLSARRRCRLLTTDRMRRSAVALENARLFDRNAAPAQGDRAARRRAAAVINSVAAGTCGGARFPGDRRPRRASKLLAQHVRHRRHVGRRSAMPRSIIVLAARASTWSTAERFRAVAAGCSVGRAVRVANVIRTRKPLASKATLHIARLERRARARRRSANAGFATAAPAQRSVAAAAAPLAATKCVGVLVIAARRETGMRYDESATAHLLTLARRPGGERSPRERAAVRRDARRRPRRQTAARGGAAGRRLVSVARPPRRDGPDRASLRRTCSARDNSAIFLPDEDAADLPRHRGRSATWRDSCRRDRRSRSAGRDHRRASAAAARSASSSTTRRATRGPCRSPARDRNDARAADGRAADGGPDGHRRRWRCGAAGGRLFDDASSSSCVGLSQQAVIAIQNARLFKEAQEARAAAEAANEAKSEFLAT